MKDSIRFLLFGSRNRSDEASPENEIHVEEKSLRALSAEQLNRMISQHVNSADWLILAECHPVVDWKQQLSDDPTSKPVVVFTHDSPWNSWTHLHTSAAAFTPFCDSPILLAIRSEFAASATPFRDVNQPIQDALIRWALSDQIKARCISGLTSKPGCYRALNPARPEKSYNWLRDCLRNLRPEQVLNRVVSDVDATAFLSGLWQMHDFLEESHELSQSVQGMGRHAAGDYWHAIMHRREPDPSNSKYWYRRVGDHPIFDDMADYTINLLNESPDIHDAWLGRLIDGGHWDPFAFVDFCTQAANSQNFEMVSLAERLQWIEMNLLLIQTVRDAEAT